MYVIEISEEDLKFMIFMLQCGSETMLEDEHIERSEEILNKIHNISQ